ncbi:lytic transglycosylase domain-containing protein [Geopseudomonas aromaticivorans]
MFDLPPAFTHNEIPYACVIQTLNTYALPPDLFIGYLGQEGGRVGMANRNSNGSLDYGPGQVNSVWLKSLRAYGVTEQSLQWDPCMNIWVSGWIMRRCLNKFSGDFWKGVGCYHVGEFPSKPAHFRRMNEYAHLVHSKAAKYRQGFRRWLATQGANEVAQR